MIEPGDNIKAILFRGVSDGWVFHAPNPRIFGRGQHYIVSTEQRERIVTMLLPRRPLLVLTVWTIGCLLVLAAMIAWSHVIVPDYPNTALASFLAASLIMALAALHLSARTKLRRLQPILVHASTTDERITSFDIRMALNKCLTTRQLRRSAFLNAFVGASCAATVAGILLLDTPSGNFLSNPSAMFLSINAIMCGLAAITSFQSAALKASEDSQSRRSDLGAVFGAEKYLSCACGIAMIAIVAVSGWSQIQREFSNLGQGQRHADKRHYDDAIASFSKAIAAQPANFAAYRERAASYLAKGDRNRAIDDYTTLLDLEPGNVLILRKRADAYRQNAALDRAVSDYDRAIDLDRKNKFGDLYYAHLFRGIAFQNKNNNDRAIDDFTAAMNISPTNHLAYYFRGISFANRNEPERAIDDLTSSIQRNPTDLYAYLSRARSHNARKDHERAIADLTKAIGIAPDSISAHSQRASTYALAGIPELAIVDFRTVLTLPASNASDRQRQDLARQQLDRLAPSAIPPAAASAKPPEGKLR